MKKNVNFDLVLFGTNQKGRVEVKTLYDKKNSLWTVNEMRLRTKEAQFNIV